jgi:hypothetical protein
MDDPVPEAIERQLASLPLAAAPSELRGGVLGLVRRQLLAQHWDRRLGRAAAAALVVGVGLNAAISWRGGQPSSNQAVVEFKPDAITQAAIAMAQATNAETGVQIARHLAALGGMTLTQQQQAEIQTQIESHSRHSTGQRKEG